MSGDATSGPVLSAETWRPAPLSAWLALLLTVGFALWIGTEQGLRRPVLAAVSGGIVAATAVVVSAGDRPRYALAGSLLLVVAAGGFAGAVSIATISQPVREVHLPVMPEGTFLYVPTGPIVVVLAFFASFGAALGVRDGLDARTTSAATGLLSFAVAPVVLVAALAMLDYQAPLDEVAANVATAGGDVVADLLAPVAPGLTTVVGLALLSTAALVALLRVDPLAGYDVDDLPRYRRYRPRLLVSGTGVGCCLLIAYLTLLVLPPGETVAILAALPAPIETTLLTVGTAAGLRWFLVWWTVVAAGVAVATVLWRRLRAVDRWAVPGTAARFSGGVVLIVAATLGLDEFDHREVLREWLAGNPETAAIVQEVAPTLVADLLGERGDALLFALATGALAGPLVLWWAVVLGLSVGLHLRLLPSRAGGYAVAGLCTFLLAVAVAIFEPGSLVLFGGVVLAFLVWDLGEFAVGVGEEVGRAAWTTHGELIHGGSAFGLGAVAFGSALVVSGFAGRAPADELGGLIVLALLASVAGLALLLSSVRS